MANSILEFMLAGKLAAYKYQTLPGCSEHIFNIGNDAAESIFLRVFFFKRLVSTLPL